MYFWYLPSAYYYDDRLSAVALQKLFMPLILHLRAQLQTNSNNMVPIWYVGRYSQDWMLTSVIAIR